MKPEIQRAPANRGFDVTAAAMIALAFAAIAIAAASADSSLHGFLPQFEEGHRRFLNGDATLWKQNASRRDDATIMGAWGAYEKGWAEVGPRYDWAVARFKDSGAKAEMEYLASSESGDLAYTVAIEHTQVQIIGQDKPAPMTLRVTHIFRKEDGAWKLVHRHADPLIAKTAPAAVLQK
jgi:ketosteroid isomerase-like protein